MFVVLANFVVPVNILILHKMCLQVFPAGIIFAQLLRYLSLNFTERCRFYQV